MDRSIDILVKEIRNCRICESKLPCGIHPVFSISAQSKILIIGQAPGLRVHKSGIPWDDKSGEELRKWLDVSSAAFYNPENFAILPMGFCYPGKGNKGDLPPRPECAPQWHEQLFSFMKNIELTLLIGKYAQDYYLTNSGHKTLTDNVLNYREYLPDFFPLPHPSPRNFVWRSKNPWFERDAIPQLQRVVRQIIPR